MAFPTTQDRNACPEQENDNFHILTPRMSRVFCLFVLGGFKHILTPFCFVPKFNFMTN